MFHEVVAINEKNALYTLRLCWSALIGSFTSMTIVYLEMVIARWKLRLG